LEEERIFRKTLGKGNKLLDQVFSNVTLQQQRVVPGDVAFQLHATHGFPLDLTMQIARERGWTVDQAGNVIFIIYLLIYS
jgi:alanyl-tRNA synthetase